MFFTAATVPTPEIVWWALVPLIVLSLAGLLLLTVSSLMKKQITWLAPLWTVGSGLIVLVSSVPIWKKVQTDGETTFLSNSVGIDGSSVFIIALLAIALIAASLIAYPYLKNEILPNVELNVLLLLSAAGGVVMAMANDLIVLFLGIEILSIAVYVLAALHLRRIESQEGAIKYFILGAFSSAFMLYGIALIYGATGSTNLVKINSFIASSLLVEDGMLMAGLAMLMVGLGFKVAAVPFHSWTPDAYQGAPTPVTAWMAAGVKAAGFAAFLRVFVLAFGPYANDWKTPIAVLAGLTVVFGAVVAVVQNDIKRMLAYSSITHAGFILIGVHAASSDGTSSVLFYLAVYTFLAIGSFAVVAVVGGKDDINHGLDAYKGLAKRQPVIASLFTVLLLGQAGIPFTGGFIAKLGVLSAAVDEKSYLLAAIAIMSAAVAAYVYLRILMAIYSDNEAEILTQDTEVTNGIWIVIGLSAAVTMVTGLVPEPLVDLARNSIPILVSG